jgi:hypothetical protein
LYDGEKWMNNVKRGVLRPLLYYGIGSLLTVFVYFTIGQGYAHGPGFHHIVAFLFLLGGGLWLVYNTIFLIKSPANRVNSVSFFCNLLVVGGFIIWFTWMINQSDSVSDEPLGESDFIKISEDGDTLLMVEGIGDTTFLQVRDSVYIDKFHRIIKCD